MGDIQYNIIQLRDRFGVTQEELANIAGVSRGAVSQWEGGWAEPRMGAIQKMADHFGIRKSNIIEHGGMESVTYSYVNLAPSGAMPIVSGGQATVPLRTLGRVHAGDLTDETAADGAVEVPSSVAASHPHAFALAVEGDCMDRVVPEGCHVMVDPDIEPRDGSIAVVETQDYQAVMRRWFKGSTTLLLRADSFEDHDDIVMTGDDPVRVIGTVVWFQSSGIMG